MTTLLSQTLDAQGYSETITVQPGETIQYSSTGTFTGFLTFMRSRTQGAAWTVIDAPEEDTNVDGATLRNETPAEERYRFALVDTDGETPVTGDVTVVITDAVTTATEQDFGSLSVKAAHFAIGDTLILAGAGVPVDYTDGTPPATGEGVAGPGSLYIDTTNAVLYINTGTKAQPIWGAFAPAA